MHIISIKDFERTEINALLDKAQEIHSKTQYERTLDGKLVALLFFEPSTRTRMSFASALARLGGTSISVDSIEGSSIIKGETLADTIRVVSGYVDAIVLRHPKEGAARLASEFASVPVINAGDGAGQHPSQTLLDLFTIRQSMPLDNLDVGLLGDLRYGRTAHSLAYALSHYNVTLHTIAPNGLEMPENLVEELKDRGTEVIEHSSVTEILQELDVLYVTRLQRERFPDSASYSDVAQSYRITPEVLTGVRGNLIILHPLPRAGEIDPRVDALPCARYFEQARNGIPIRMAMLEEVMR
jgi:aspartate carbamoyltransferase catalytic subunit